MNTPLFSIIIPHFSIPNLLQRSLSSIPEREDIQVIVVDDDSPDHDQYPVSFPALFRPGVQWIQAPHHGGAGYCRNLGLDKAEGKWLLFADADDYFSEEFPALLDEYKDSKDDILIFRKRAVMSDDTEIPSNRDEWMDKVFDKAIQTGNPRLLSFNYWANWAKMFRRDLICSNGIRFDEIPYSNDVMFSVTAASKAQTVRIVDRVLYVLTEREGSLTWPNTRKPGEQMIRTEVVIRAQKVMNESGFSEPLFPLSHSLYKMYYYDRPLYRQFFRRIPEVYPSYWIPLKEMAAYERGPLRKGLLYAYSLFTYLTTRTAK